MSELLDLAEKAGHENMREHIEVASMIQREANTLMALLLAGAGTALAYAGSGKGMNPGITWAALAVCLYLFSLAAALNWKCLSLTTYPSAFNEPKSLNKPEYRVEQLRQWELENLQERISQAGVINTRRADWLNRCRYAATLTPLVAVIGWGAAYLVADAVPAVAALVAGWG